MDLMNLQQQMQDFILHGQASNDLINIIQTPAHGSAGERLQIYADMYRLRLLEVLEQDFPASKARLTEAQFIEAGERYIEVHPSQDYRIHYFSHRFAQMILNTEPYCQDPILCALVKFEKAIVLAEQSASFCCKTLEDLQLIPEDRWADIRITVQENLTLLSSNYDLVAIYADALKDQLAADYAKHPTDLLVFLQQQQTYQIKLDKPELAMFKAFRQGQCFAQVCEQLISFLPEEQVAEYAVSKLVRWLNEGIITDIRLSA